MLEIRIHGRGGQGAVIASKVLAEAFFREGQAVQSFPAFGVERRGAPIAAFVRCDDRPIRLRSQIYRPDHLIVLDATLLQALDLTAGLAPGGWILINSPAPPEALGLPAAFRVATVDAGALALAHGLGSAVAPIVNTAILGAFAGATGLVGLASIEAAIRSQVPARREENVAAAREAHAQVRCGAPSGHPPQADSRSVPPRAVPAAEPSPPVAVSRGSMAWNRTGSWRSITPVRADLPAPCQAACPAGVPIREALGLAREGRFDEAAALVLAENPLAGVTGRVCPHPCEAACNRVGLDGAVAIRALERFLADRQGPLPGGGGMAPGERVAVIGSGPAGLSCAFHLARRGYRVTLFEAARSLGGLLRHGIPPYRLPRDVLDWEIDRILALGVEVQRGARLGEALPWSTLEEYGATFLATGAGRERPMGIEGEVGRVLPGLGLLRALNKGNQVRVGPRVLVIGGGNTAIDVARAAVRLGGQVTVAYRRTREAMPAIREEVEAAASERVAFRFLTQPVRLLPGEGAHRLQCVGIRLGPPDRSGRPAPEPIPGSEFVLEAETIVSAVGEEVDPTDLPESLATPSEARPMDAWGRTAVPGLFVGGDVAGGRRTVADAIGSGRRAAMAMDAYLRGESAPREGPIPEPIRLDPGRLDAFTPLPRIAIPELALADRLRDFGEVVGEIGSGAAAWEATRCLSCGACVLCDVCWQFCPDVAIARAAQGYVIDYDHCKGCLICYAECPRGAISLEAAAASLVNSSPPAGGAPSGIRDRRTAAGSG